MASKNYNSENKLCTAGATAAARSGKARLLRAARYALLRSVALPNTNSAHEPVYWANRALRSRVRISAERSEAESDRDDCRRQSAPQPLDLSFAQIKNHILIPLQISLD